MLQPKLDRLVGKFENVLLKKVDIGTWESAAAAQAGKEFGLESLPHVFVYGTKGNLLGEVKNASIEDIEALVRREAK